MANQQLYGQRGFSSIYNYNTTTNTSTTRSTIDSTSYLPDSSLLSSSSRYLSTYSNPYSLSTDPTPTFKDPLRSSSNISGALAAPASRSFLTTATSSTPLWPSFDVSSSLTKRPSEALYDKSVVGSYMPGQSEAWLAFDSLAKRPRLESASNLPIYPKRPGEKDCVHYMLTRTCKFGDKCKFDHPIWVPEGGIPDWKELPSVPSESYPERPGEPDCPYFLKTEKCKFGLNCKFNHPKDKLAASGNASALPERPSEPLCAFYMKTGKCKFGDACKFHHPKNIQIPLAGQEAGNIEKNISIPNAVTINDVDSVKNQISSPALSYNSKGLPIRLGEMDCPFYIKTGSCKYGVNCRYSHPDRNELLSPFSAINPPAATIGHSVLTSSVANLNAGLLNPAASILQSLSQTTIGPGYPTIYPQRPGQIECDYYMKTGECKFGERCRFHHPIDRSAPKLTLAGLPRREVQKIQLLTPNIGVVYSGMGPDSRVLVRKSRKQAEQYHRLYKEPIPVTQLVRETAAVMQEFTQSGGVRPFGVSLLIAGFDDNGPQLYQVDPSGSYFSWKASAMGKNVSNAKTFLEKRYTDDMELDDAVHTAILTLKEGFEGQISGKNIEIGIIGTDRKFRVLAPAEIDDYLGEVE